MEKVNNGLRVIGSEAGELIIILPFEKEETNKDDDGSLSLDTSGNLSFQCSGETIFSFNTGKEKEKLFRQAFDEQKIFVWQATRSGIVVKDKVKFI